MTLPSPLLVPSEDLLPEMYLSDTATYTLKVAFDEFVAGVFTLESPLDGTDVLTDVGQFAGTFDDVSDDVDGATPVQIVFGTDSLAGQVQAGNLTVSVGRVDDPGFWNPNNPTSPLNELNPGFVPMRPVLYTATQDGDEFTLFRGWIRRATWRSDSRMCELYCEDFLLWCSRVYPQVASTGPTTVGAVIEMLFLLVDPTCTPRCDAGKAIGDFSADGTVSVTQLVTSLLEADRGSVFVDFDGTPVYEQHDTPLARDPAATIVVTEQASDLESGIDLDSIGTRVDVTATSDDGDETWASVDTVAERRYGRADIPAVSSPYVKFGQELADDLVYEGVNGRPPITVTVANADPATLNLMLSSPLQTVFALDDSFGGTTIDAAVVQQMTHTISTGLHTCQYLMTRRPARAFRLDSALDGSDVFRY